MHQINLNEELYRQAQEKAAKAGFESVDEYVAEVLQTELADAENLDRFFTPERLAHVDRAIAEIEAGGGITAEQVRDHLRKKRNG